MYKTVVYTAKTWNFVKRGSQKILLLTVAVQIFAGFTKKHKYWSLFVIKWIFIEKTPWHRCFSVKFLKAPFLHNPSGWLLLVRQVVTYKWHQNDITEAIVVTLMLALNVFLPFAITLEAAIQNNLTKSWDFQEKCLWCCSIIAWNLTKPTLTRWGGLFY